MKENLRIIFMSIGVAVVVCATFWMVWISAIHVAKAKPVFDGLATNHVSEDYTLTWHKLSNGYALDISITNAIGGYQDTSNSFTFLYGPTGKVFRVRILPYD